MGFTALCRLVFSNKLNNRRTAIVAKFLVGECIPPFCFFKITVDNSASSLKPDLFFTSNFSLCLMLQRNIKTKVPSGADKGICLSDVKIYIGDAIINLKWEFPSITTSVGDPVAWQYLLTCRTLHLCYPLSII